MPTKDEASDLVADGLTAFASGVGDLDMARTGASFYSLVRSAVDDLFVESDECRLAMATVFIAQGVRAPCMCLFMADRFIVAWGKGFFRRQTLATVTPYADIRELSVHRGVDASTRNAHLLTIKTNSGSISIGLPLGKVQTAESLIRSAIR